MVESRSATLVFHAQRVSRMRGATLAVRATLWRAIRREKAVPIWSKDLLQAHA